MNQELIDSLNLFKRQTNKLRSNKDFFKNLKLRLEYKQGKRIVSEFLNRPDDRSIKSFLIDFRPFLLNDEPICFYRVCNLLYQNLDDDKLKEEVKWARKAWGILLERKKNGPVGAIRLKLGKKNILSEENLNAWLYGEYFHLDEDNINLLKQMNLEPIKGLSFYIFLDLLQGLSKVVFYLEKRVVNKVLKEN